MNDLKYAVVIPARYKSSRFPGKPLIDLAGKPMIQHVWEKCCEAVESENVFIATDSELIQFAVKNFGGNVIMTSENCLTGTDRIAEANKILKYDFVINVQGDEPLIKPADISKIIECYLDSPNKIYNAMCKIDSESEFNSNTVPKVVTTLTGKLLYMSRSGIPLTKDGRFVKGFKQVCIYAFSKEHLDFFIKNNNKTPLELIEDIEILRFLESDYEIQMVEVEAGSLAVDVPEDVHNVLELLTTS
jgi:3-deoxy-manno-octulosonate cytidylyltransferase (CMP-KDO synthetase)